MGYVVSNYAGDLGDMRSTSGCVFTLVRGPICRKSSIQSIVVMSTTEEEYMAVVEVAKRDQANFHSFSLSYSKASSSLYEYTIQIST